MPCPPGCWRRFPRRGIRTPNWPAGPISERFISSETSRKTTASPTWNWPRGSSTPPSSRAGIAASAPHRRWSVPWTHWPPEHPHRVLAGHLGLVNGVLCIDPGDGNPVVGQHRSGCEAADLGCRDGRASWHLHRWRCASCRSARRPPARDRTVIVLLAADGMLYTWEYPAAALLRRIPVAPFLAPAGQAARNPISRYGASATPDGRQFAIVGGRGYAHPSGTCRRDAGYLSSGRRHSGGDRVRNAYQRKDRNYRLA